MADKKKTEQPDGCVLYVDGGCRPGYLSQPNTKYGGWGMHGYTYHVGVTPPSKRTKKDVPTKSGYQIGEKTTLEEQVVPVGYIDGYGSMSDKDSSDRAELTGFKQAIEVVRRGGYKEAHLLLDNQYVIDGVNTFYPKWESLNWRKPDGSHYANKEMWRSIMDVYKPLSENISIKVTWVNGHSGNLGNDRADYLATKGVYLGRNGVLNNENLTHSPVAKYRDPKPEINRLFAKSRWYFSTHEKEPATGKTGRYVYHCGSHGSDDTLIGKPMADSVACVIMTKDMQKVLELVRQRHMEYIDNPLNDLCLARLDTLLLPRIYHEIETDGPNVLSIAPRKLRIDGLCTIDEQEVTRIIKPSGLTFKLIKVHNFLEEELERYLEGKGTYTDVTDKLYMKKEVKKGKETIEEYEITLEPTDKAFKVEVDVCSDVEKKVIKKHKVTLTVGIDIPPRELMRAIMPRKPKVSIVTWSLSEYAFTYAIIFDLGDDVMIWQGKDSSLKLVYPEDMLKVNKS